MVDQRLLETKTRMEFFRNSYRRGVKQLLTLLVLIAILIIALFYEVLNQPPRKFYASTEAGEIVKLNPLDGPNESSTPLIQ